jgi:3-hydroxy-9,10-secoandrosta-1,3,5(10)-triene-9,17-dione monooxygenase reductase component
MTTMQNSPPTQAGDAADHETRNATFRSVARRWPSGVAVITTLDELEDRHGLTMSAAIALSLEPVQFPICVDDNSNTLPVLLRRGKFCINFLAEGQESITLRFASKRGLKFEDFRYDELDRNSAVLDGIVAYADCAVRSVYDGGDHRIIVGLVVDMALRDGRPLTYQAGRFCGVN